MQIEKFNYTKQIKQGGYPRFEHLLSNKKPGFIDRIMSFIFTSTPKKETVEEEITMSKLDRKDSTLKDEIRKIIEMPDEQYSEKMLSSELRRYVKNIEKDFQTTLSDIKSHIAPSYWEVQSNMFNVAGMFGKTYYAHNYPSYIDSLRTRDVLAFHEKWDMSFYIYPEDNAAIQSMLKNKATQLKSEINDATSKGITIDTEVEVQYRDVETIREKLATREERYFELGYYINLYEMDTDKLIENGRKLEQRVSGYGIKIKNAVQRMDEGQNASLPLANDMLGITRSMLSSSLGSAFPFIANDIIQDTGIFYGVNLQTGALVIFDRFNNKLPNMNSVVLATSGAGKSFSVKLEIIRYLLLGKNIIVIDPENEYKELCENLGGTYINISTGANQFINPFDIPPKIEDVDYGKGDLLRSQIVNLVGLVGVLVGGVTPEQEAILDKAIQNTYSLKGITMNDSDYTGKQPPIMGDLLNILENMDGGENLALRLSKYVTGTFGKLFNNYTNIDISSQLTVFSIRDIEEALKTSAMYNILNFIWTKVRSKKMHRLLIVDEARIMLQNAISANFLFGLIKRARKYGLGITTISQDIEDFVKSEYGKPIISNSAFQLLLKQSTSSIKSLSEILGLTEAEKQRLVSANIGEGLLFSGNQHVSIKIIASPEERAFITTDVK